MKNKIKNPRACAGAGFSKKTNLNDITTVAQRQRLWDCLKKRPITTIEARIKLNILAPAARIYELRHKFGLNIQTVWVEDFTPENRRHRVAKYVLLAGKWEGKK